MSEHVGLVRAVMQGREGLTREVLLDALAGAGGHDAHTFHATGNVLFDAADGAAVCARLSAALTDLLGRDTPVLHRSVVELAALLAAEPFAGAPAGAERIVVHLATPPDPPAVAAALGDDDLELCAVLGADVCVVRHGRRHPMPALERLGTPATSRSVRTLAGLVRRATA